MGELIVDDVNQNKTTMTRFPSLATATLLLLSVAATAADTGPFTVQSDDSVAARRILASCTNTKKGTFKVEGSTKKRNCKGWANKGKCNSNLNKESGKVSSVCGKSCVTNTKKGTFKIEGSKNKKTCAGWANKKNVTKISKTALEKFLRYVVSHVTIAQRHQQQHHQRHRPKHPR